MRMDFVRYCRFGLYSGKRQEGGKTRCWATLKGLFLRPAQAATKTQGIRESTGSDLKKDAQKLLRKRMAEMGSGKLVGPDEEKVTVAELLEGIQKEYMRERRRSAKRLGSSLNHLLRHFGHYRALDITTTRMKSYIADRQEEGASNSTIQKETAAMKRAFNIAVEDSLLSHAPKIPTPTVSNTRKGFFAEGDLRGIIAELPDDLKPVVRFASLTGWRKTEIITLRWSQVDIEAGTIRLEPGTTKNDEGREIPFRALPELADLIEEQRQITNRVERDQKTIITHVFHRNGEPIGCFRGAWDAACKRVGQDGAWFHDLRRTAVRRLEMAGVSRSVAMKITGHKTESVYRRYAITDRKAIEHGMKKIHQFRQEQTEKRTSLALRKGA